MKKTNPKTSKAGTKKTVEAPANNNETVVVTPQPTETESVETPKPVERQLKKSLSDAELAERLALARTRKGEIVNFLCTKTQDLTIGLIRTARLDKRSGFIQFRIEVLEYPEGDQTLENATGNWLVDGQVECPIRRTGIIWGKGDDSKDLRIVGHYAALPKASKEEPAEEPAPAPQEGVKPAKKDKKGSKKTAPKSSDEDAAMAAAMADMAAEGLM